MTSSGYELGELLDLDRVQRVCDSLSDAFDIALAVLDLSGTVLIATGWQDICTQYHREHPETLQGCLESDLRINQRLVEGLDANDHYAYRCSNGLWDVAFPLTIGGEHVANVYTGQFFFDDDDVDVAEFAERARRLGFDEEQYLRALARVPVISHARQQKTLGFLADFVGMLGEMGMTVLQRAQKHAELKESEERYRRLFDNATEGIVVFRVDRGGEDRADDIAVVDINPVQSAKVGLSREQTVGRRLADCSGADERMHEYCSFVAGAIADDLPARREVRLPGQDVYELLSAYPAGGDLWALSSIDVTEARKAQQALRQQEEGIRRAYVDVLDAVTGGKLILLTEDELAAELGEPISEVVAFSSPAKLAETRRLVAETAERRYPGQIRQNDLLTTVGEALDNAIKHARGGTYQAFAKDHCLQVAVSDDGPGIDFRTLPRATLVRGFSTAASLGMGFTIMLQLCERVLLSTRPGRTAVVLELAVGQQAAQQGGRAASRSRGSVPDDS